MLPLHLACRRCLTRTLSIQHVKMGNFVQFCLQCKKRNSLEENKAHLRIVASITFMRDVDLSIYLLDREDREKDL